MKMALMPEPATRGKQLRYIHETEQFVAEIIIIIEILTTYRYITHMQMGMKQQREGGCAETQ